MKLLPVLLLCVAVASAANVQLQNEQVVVVAAAEETVANVQLQKEEVVVVSDAEPDTAQEQVEDRNSILINALVRQLIALIRRVVRQNYDPLEMEHYELNLPAGILNLELTLENVYATGFGDFEFHRSDLNLRSDPITFDIDVSVPHIDLRAGAYDLLGDFFTAIPFYGQGNSVFDIRDFRFQGRVILKQSDDGKAIVIERIEDPSYQVPHFKPQMSGVIGGGDIDQIVNAVLEEVIIGYLNRFQNAVSPIVAQIIQDSLNPMLEDLDTWRFIAPFV